MGTPALPSAPVPVPVAVPEDVYGMFAGAVDAASLQKFTAAFDLASKGVKAGLKRLHLAMQSQGGGIGEGIAL